MDADDRPQGRAQVADQTGRSLGRGAGNSRGRLFFRVIWIVKLVVWNVISERRVSKGLSVRLDLHD
jgi:hypothetical protein